MLFAAVVLFMVRDARHRGRQELLGQVLYQTQQDRVFWLRAFWGRRAAEEYYEPIEAAQAAEAARRGEVVPVLVPLSQRHAIVGEDRRHLKSFGPPTTSQNQPEAGGGQPEAVGGQPEAVIDVSVPLQTANYPEELNPFAENEAVPSSHEVLAIENENFIGPCPEGYSAASNGIRQKLEDIFEPRPSPRPSEADSPEVNENSSAAVIVVHAEVHTATIKKKRRAPPPPTLPKPTPEKVAAAVTRLDQRRSLILGHSA